MNHFERSLVDIVSTLTGLERDAISPNDTFDQQGIDSLLALRLMREVRERTGVELELEDLFDHPSIHRLAGYVQTRAMDLAA